MPDSAIKAQELRIGDPLPDSSIVGYMRCDPSGKLRAANDTLAAWLGVSGPRILEGMAVEAVIFDAEQFADWLSLPDRTRISFDLQATGDERKAVNAELRHPNDGTRDIELVMVEDTGAPLVPRVAELEAALTLTSGTVHDINNVLTVLSGTLFLLAEKLRGEGGEAFEQARRARNAAKRGSSLLRELLSFNRGRDSVARAMSPANHILGLEPLLKRAVGSARELTIQVGKDTGSVEASANQFESALINLVKNACDAVGEDGRIVIQAQDLGVAPEQESELGVPAGDYVVVGVKDNGCGIPAEQLHRVTQAKFTTKGAGKGSGLGLAMVSDFVKRSQGVLRIKSQEGKGTTVYLWLPRVNAMAETTANMTLPLSTLPGGEERILVVSRDQGLRDSLQDMLGTLGYTVVVCDSMEAAGEVIAAATPPPLMICDSLPGSGRSADQLVARMHDAEHRMRLISLVPVGEDPEKHAANADAWLLRPVDVPDLAKTVRKTLDRE